jgi:RNA ligase (TIGR02306 family)
MPRKLATIRRITGINPIPGKDLIEQYSLGGWLVVDQKGAHQIGDLVVYIEPDSWVPLELAPFLERYNKIGEFNGVRGSKLRTIRLGGAVSQGLIMRIMAAPLPNTIYTDGEDVSELLGIQLWEPPPPNSADAKGPFPSFLIKTDQERIQNCFAELAALPPETTFEVTEKLEGQSYTAYIKDGVFGVCSRGLELKLDKDSVWKQVADRYRLEEKLRTLGRNLAIQGEQVGPGINGNIYGLTEPRLYVFDIFDIDKFEYLLPDEARVTADELGLDYVPIVAFDDLRAWMSTESLLEFADKQKSRLAPVLAEGFVFKSNTAPRFSFKAVSNTYLLRDKKATPWPVKEQP